MLTTGDIKVIKNIISEAVAPLATKDELKTLATKVDLAKLDTKITKLDVKMSGEFADLKNKTTKDMERLERAIKTEHKIGNVDFGYLEDEDRKIKVRVERIEHHIGFASA